MKNETNRVLNDVAFSVYAPVELTATQKVLQLQVSHEYTLEKDKYHNQVMHFTYDRLAPFESRIVRVRAELAMAEEPNAYPNMQTKSFIQAEAFVESDHSKIISLSEKLTKKQNNKHCNLFLILLGIKLHILVISKKTGALYMH